MKLRRRGCRPCGGDPRDPGYERDDDIEDHFGEPPFVEFQRAAQSYQPAGEREYSNIQLRLATGAQGEGENNLAGPRFEPVVTDL